MPRLPRPRLPLARWPPTAAFVLGLALLGVAWAGTVPPKYGLLALAWLAALPVGHLLGVLWSRRVFRQMRAKPCAGCGRMLAGRVWEMLGFCVQCGEYAPAATPPGDRARGARS